MASIEEKFENLQLNEGSKMSKKNSRYPESVSQMLKLKYNLGGAIFQRFNDKIEDSQLDEVSNKIQELSEFFEKLLQESGYEKPQYRRRRFNYRRRFNNGNAKGNSTNNEEPSSSDKENNENKNNQNNDPTSKKPKKNYNRRYNKRNKSNMAGKGQPKSNEIGEAQGNGCPHESNA
uniref:Uncharacterized protein n=1 Tax=Strongyloides papillosus TaxID=174720 RepID=A0A0N5BHI4_STREA